MASSKESLLIRSDAGLYCPQGDFFIDPLKPVDKALVTHAHSDHARSGSRQYLTAAEGKHVMRSRLGSKAMIETIAYGERCNIGGVNVSFHSAGHVLGSAQIRLEYRGQIWVVSGDYKTKYDPTCSGFEQLQAHCFITESTFGLPIYRWPSSESVASEINSWWAENQSEGRCSVVFAYSFGKAQRVMSMLDESIGPIYVHPAVDELNKQYIASGCKLPSYGAIGEKSAGNGALLGLSLFPKAMVIAPPSVFGSDWCNQLGDFSPAFASGWMRIRANRKRQAMERGFIVSDHADWDELNQVIQESGAQEIIVHHGYVGPLVRDLRRRGFNASSFASRGRDLSTLSGKSPKLDRERSNSDWLQEDS
ncbi:MAG: ligase-associated DNA damage response exonuclease [Candidatus Obscuribacterales bacterium]|nr:ligase-associated DNA damage response exonuclease [Candidatus Obscuribacterales bacterium]